MFIYYHTCIVCGVCFSTSVFNVQTETWSFHEIRLSSKSLPSSQNNKMTKAVFFVCVNWSSSCCWWYFLWFENSSKKPVLLCFSCLQLVFCAEDSCFGWNRLTEVCIGGLYFYYLLCIASLQGDTLKLWQWVQCEISNASSERRFASCPLHWNVKSVLLVLAFIDD